MIHIIAPRKKEFGCGVHDHSKLIADALSSSGIRVLIHHASEEPFSYANSAAAGDVFLLQLSIYGYQTKGIPTWLPAQLAIIKARGAQIITFFHELWVQWPSVKTSAFWLAPLQYSICKRILSLSDISVFNVEWGYEWAKINSTARIEYITTCSTIGEPESQLSPWSERQNTLVVFGNPRARLEGYKRLLQKIASLKPDISSLCIDDIGAMSPQLEELLASFGPLAGKFLAIRRHGPLASGDVRRVLATSKFGLFTARWNHVGKSSVFAAYAAHGMCPVSIYPPPHASQNLRFAPKPAVHYALLDNMDLTTAASSEIYSGIANSTRSAYTPQHALVDLLLSQVASPHHLQDAAT